MKRKQTKNYPSTPTYQAAPNSRQFTKLINLLEALVDRHEKILVCRLDLLGHGLPDHKDIQFLIAKAKDKYGSAFFGYAWSCEHSTEAGKQVKHYHIVIFLNGHKYQSDYKHMDTLLLWWKLKTGLSGRPGQYDAAKGERNSVGLLRRADAKKFDDVIYGLSYLCKMSQKADSSETMFNMTQLKSITDKEHYRQAA